MRYRPRGVPLGFQNIAGEGHRVLAAAFATQGVQPQRTVSVVVAKFTDGPETRQPLDVFSADGNANKPNGFRKTTTRPN